MDDGVQVNRVVSRSELVAHSVFKLWRRQTVQARRKLGLVEIVAQLVTSTISDSLVDLVRFSSKRRAQSVAARSMAKIVYRKQLVLAYYSTVSALGFYAASKSQRQVHAATRFEEAMSRAIGSASLGILARQSRLCAFIDRRESKLILVSFLEWIDHLRSVRSGLVDFASVIGGIEYRLRQLAVYHFLCCIRSQSKPATELTFQSQITSLVLEIQRPSIFEVLYSKTSAHVTFSMVISLRECKNIRQAESRLEWICVSHREHCLSRSALSEWTESLRRVKKAASLLASAVDQIHSRWCIGVFSFLLQAVRIARITSAADSVFEALHSKGSYVGTSVMSRVLTVVVATPMRSGFTQWRTVAINARQESRHRVIAGVTILSRVHALSSKFGEYCSSKGALLKALTHIRSHNSVLNSVAKRKSIRRIICCFHVWAMTAKASRARSNSIAGVVCTISSVIDRGLLRVVSDLRVHAAQSRSQYSSSRSSALEEKMSAVFRERNAAMSAAMTLTCFSRWRVFASLSKQRVRRLTGAVSVVVRRMRQAAFSRLFSVGMLRRTETLMERLTTASSEANEWARYYVLSRFLQGFAHRRLMTGLKAIQVNGLSVLVSAIDLQSDERSGAAEAKIQALQDDLSKSAQSLQEARAEASKWRSQLSSTNQRVEELESLRKSHFDLIGEYEQRIMAASREALTVPPKVQSEIEQDKATILALRKEIQDQKESIEELLLSSQGAKQAILELQEAKRLLAEMKDRESETNTRVKELQTSVERLQRVNEKCVVDSIDALRMKEYYRSRLELIEEQSRMRSSMSLRSSAVESPASYSLGRLHGSSEFQHSPGRSGYHPRG